MSFMNPVDLVEEDAADLQFPKGRPQIVTVKPSAATEFVTRHYDVGLLNQTPSIVAVSNEELCASCSCALQEPYIKCAECEDTRMCLQCFARGCETVAHSNCHAYIIIKDDIQVFPGTSDWTAKEERLLLSTLETEGYGNWEAVSRALSGKRTPDACKQHYHDCYFGGIFERLLNLTHAKETYFPLHTPFVTKMKSVDPPRNDDITSVQFHMMAGYRCARGDFDTPYDNSAETILTSTVLQQADVEPTEDDNDDYRDIEEELQCALVRAYNHRLSERQRRYQIMRDNGLIMINRTIGWISKYAECLGSESNCMRFLIFMQLCEPMAFDMLVESMQHFTDIHKTIIHLFEARRNGVRTLAGARLYFKLKKKRQLEQRERSRLNEQCNWRKLIVNAKLASNNPFVISQATTTTPRRKAGPIDISGMQGYSKLNDDERELCSVVRIVPQAYLDYKSIFMTENAKHGCLRLADARKLIKIDVNKTRQIYDFLLTHGFINKPQ